MTSATRRFDVARSHKRWRLHTPDVRRVVSARDGFAASCASWRYHPVVGARASFTRRCRDWEGRVQLDAVRPSADRRARCSRRSGSRGTALGDRKPPDLAGCDVMVPPSKPVQVVHAGTATQSGAWPPARRTSRVEAAELPYCSRAGDASSSQGGDPALAATNVGLELSVWCGSMRGCANDAGAAGGRASLGNRTKPSVHTVLCAGAQVKGWHHEADARGRASQAASGRRGKP
jgi:hypothetical protein